MYYQYKTPFNNHIKQPYMTTSRKLEKSNDTHEILFKALCNYLPYELKFESHTPFEYDILTMVGIRKENGFLELLDKEGSMWINSIKPILRPLSDLNTEIMNNGKKINPLHELLKMRYPKWFNEHKFDKYSMIHVVETPVYFDVMFSYHSSYDLRITKYLENLEKEPFWILEKLHEWHFDTKGLIEKGLAINQNTIKQ